MPFRICAIFILLAAGLHAAPARAQVQGTGLAGAVTDAQGAVLPGVTVTASSPALIGTQTVVTEPTSSESRARRTVICRR